MPISSFIPISMSCRKIVQLRTISWIFPRLKNAKNIITFEVSNGVNARFVHRVLWVHHARQILLQCVDQHTDHQVGH